MRIRGQPHSSIIPSPTRPAQPSDLPSFCRLPALSCEFCIPYSPAMSRFPLKSILIMVNDVVQVHFFHLVSVNLITVPPPNVSGVNGQTNLFVIKSSAFTYLFNLCMSAKSTNYLLTLSSYRNRERWG